jgi:hypothetical protein
MTTYAADDIRSQLATAAPAPAVDPATPIRPAQWIEFLTLPPTETAAAGSRTWVARAANLVIAYTDAKAGDVFPRSGQPDEYAVLMYSGSAAVTVTAGGAAESVAEEALVVVPPGDSEVRVDTDGVLIRLFSHRAEDLTARAPLRWCRGRTRWAASHCGSTGSPTPPSPRAGSAGSSAPRT